MVENWCHKKYVNGLTISLVGNASDFEISAINLHDIRGHITIDYTGVYTDTSYTGSNILSCTNVDYVTLVGDNAQNSPTNICQFFPFSFSHIFNIPILNSMKHHLVVKSFNAMSITYSLVKTVK